MKRRSSAPPTRTSVTPRREQDVRDPEAHRAMALSGMLRALFGEDSVLDFELPKEET